MTCQSLISDLNGGESSPARDKGTSPGRAEAAATPLSGRRHTAPPAVCYRPLGGVAAASGRHRDVLFAQMVKSRFCNAGCATVKWH